MKVYEENLKKFLEEVGNKEKQENYFSSLSQYRFSRRKYLKQLRLRKKGLIKVYDICNLRCGHVLHLSCQ